MAVLFLIDEVRMGIYIYVYGRNGRTYLVKSTGDLLNLPMSLWLWTWDMTCARRYMPASSNWCCYHATRHLVTG